MKTCKHRPCTKRAVKNRRYCPHHLKEHSRNRYSTKPMGIWAAMRDSQTKADDRHIEFNEFAQVIGTTIHDEAVWLPQS